MNKVIKLLKIEERHKLDISSVGTIYYSGRPWVWYGSDNLFPQNLVDITLKSATHNSIIKTKQYLTFGEGLSKNKNKVMNSKGETLSQIVRKSVNDYIMFGGFALWVGYDSNGKVNRLKHIDFTKVRSGFANELDEVSTYYIRNDWSVQTYRAKKDNSVIELPAYNTDNYKSDKDGQLFYYYKPMSGIDYYPQPDWIGAKEEIMNDYELSNYLAAIFSNAYMPKSIISIKGENTDEANKELYRDLMHTYQGTDNAGKPLILSNGSEESPVDVQNIDSILADPQYKEFVATVTSKIVNAHRIPRVIAGIETNSGFSNTADEIRVAYELFENVVISDYRNDIQEAFSQLGIDFELIQTDLISASLSEDALLKVLTTNEIREQYGYQPLAENTQTLDQPTENIDNTNNTEPTN